MTLAEYSVVAFALLNGGRIVAYVPQMVRVYRDPNGATAVSVITWTLFAAANIATVCYALTVFNDRVMAAVFALNTAGCLAIVGLTALKRAARPELQDAIPATIRAPRDISAKFASNAANTVPEPNRPL